MTMDENLIQYYSKLARRVRKKRKYPSIKNFDDLIEFLKIEQEAEQFQFNIEHSGDSPEWRILALANLAGRPMVSASLKIDLLSKMQQKKLKEIIKDFYVLPSIS